MNHYDVIVVGGGASGMMAAGTAALRGKRVLLLEKNVLLGAKLAITGGGRCNIMNAEEDVRVLLSHYGKAEQFLYSPFAIFGMKDTWKFFESRGLPLIVQDRKRAFPHTENAKDVVALMKNYLSTNKVVVKTGSPVQRIEMKNNGITALVVGNTRYTASSYILATGGMSHPETGSTGDGFDWLKQLGHSVKASTPTIVPLATRESWSKVLSGTTLHAMKITFFANGKKAFSKTGNLLFTHFGLSGPLILNSAAAVNDLLVSGNKVTALIDMYPSVDLGVLEDTVIKKLELFKNKLFKNVISEIVPQGMSPGICKLIEKEISSDTKVHSLTKEQRHTFVRVLKHLPLTITNLMGYERAVVADGGVSLTEIDMKTMRSKKIANLFVTGDLLDITRPSGGYSLQLCWTTGYIAGMNA